MTFPSEDQPFLEIECSPSCWLFPYDPLSCLTEGDFFAEENGILRIDGFYCFGHLSKMEIE
ncbi:hypothetical protein CHCC20335_2008 [Bacillus paralicheniformis]|nr:hypothetical protein CHCC20335_2008 [Bacillus paralicheniformis]